MLIYFCQVPHSLSSSSVFVFTNVLCAFFPLSFVLLIYFVCVCVCTVQVKYKLRQNQKEDEDLLIGSAARAMLVHPEKHNLRESRVKHFYTSVREYFVTVVGYLLEKLPLGDPVLKAVSVADPAKRLQVSCSDLGLLLDRFPVLISKDSSRMRSWSRYFCFHH